jgi:hypothetical protein
MKHLKKIFENKDILDDLFYLLIDIEDSYNYIIYVESVDGFRYRLHEISHNFKLKRYDTDTALSFAISINTKRRINYSEFIELATLFDDKIERIKSYGWYLYDFNIATNPNRKDMTFSNIKYTFGKVE